MQYFICYRSRCPLDLKYVHAFIEEMNPKMHSTYAEAEQIMHDGFYDDCDNQVCTLNTNGTVTIPVCYGKSITG